MPPAQRVNEFLHRMMIADPASARRYVSPALQPHFTGDRAMRDPDWTSALNATQHRQVQRRIERSDTLASSKTEEAPD